MDHVQQPSPRRVRKDALRNRDRVLDAATQLVRSVGDKVPMADIADRAGVGIGTVYRHFPTRQALLGALVHRSFEIAVANAETAAGTPGSALDGIRSFLLATLRDRDQFVLPLHGGPALFTAETRALQSEVRTALRRLLERGRDVGELRIDLTPEDLIVAASALSRPLPGTNDWDALARRQIELLVYGLGPTGRS